MKLLKIFAAMSLMLGLLAAEALAQCQAQFQRAWDKAQIFANALGPDCGQAVLVLSVRDGQGHVLWASAHRAGDLMTFQESGKLTASRMPTQLAEWIAEDKRRQDSSALPDWPASSTEGSLPPQAEFPFRVSEELTRAEYLGLRKARLPILCFVAGMESEICLVLKGNSVTEIGTQSFPG